jgi:hypothetical protein
MSASPPPISDARKKTPRSPLKWAAIGLTIVAVTYLAGVTTWIDQWRGMRQGNEYEAFYWYIAQQLDEPSICDKISWAARLPGGFFISPSYERSECYEMVAGRTRNSQPCWKVRRLGAQSIWNDQVSMWSCVRHAVDGWHGGTGISGESLVRFFRLMGYDPEELHAEGVTRPIVDVRDIYRRLPQEPDLVARIEASLQMLGRKNDPAQSDVEDAAYLAQMAALVSKDALWCQRIPDELLLAGHQHFRDWCMYTLATNIRDADLCRRIPIRPDPIARAGEPPPAYTREVSVQMSLHGQCGWHVSSSIPDNTRYGPELPADDERTRRLIGSLGYPIPRASTLTQQRLEEAYGLFLTVLTGADAARYAPARKRLIERVKSLPDISWQGAPVVDHGAR